MTHGPHERKNKVYLHTFLISRMSLERMGFFIVTVKFSLLLVFKAQNYQQKD